MQSIPSDSPKNNYFLEDIFCEEVRLLSHTYPVGVFTCMSSLFQSTCVFTCILFSLFSPLHERFNAVSCKLLKSVMEKECSRYTQIKRKRDRAHAHANLIERERARAHARSLFQSLTLRVYEATRLRGYEAT